MAVWCNWVLATQRRWAGGSTTRVSLLRLPSAKRLRTGNAGQGRESGFRVCMQTLSAPGTHCRGRSGPAPARPTGRSVPATARPTTDLRVCSQFGIDGPPPIVDQSRRLPHVAHGSCQLEADGAIGTAYLLGAAATAAAAQMDAGQCCTSMHAAAGGQPARCQSWVLASCSLKHAAAVAVNQFPPTQIHCCLTGHVCRRRGMHSEATRPAAVRCLGCRAGRRLGWAECQARLPGIRRG